MLHRMRMMVLAFISLTVTFVMVAPSASAAGSETIVSKYDSQHEDSLQLLVSYTTAECDKKGGGSTPWFSDLQVTNGSETIDIDVSFVPNTGGTLNPGTSAMYRYSSTSTNPFTASFTFQVNLDGAESETASISIPAPEPGCDSSDAQAVDCWLGNYTNPSVRNDDGSYNTGQEFNIYAHLTDQNLTVQEIVYQKSLNGGEWQTIRTVAAGGNPETLFVLNEAGTWAVRAVLKDGDGNVITPTGDCEHSYTIRAASTGQPAPTPVPTDPTPTATPVSNTPTATGEATPTSVTVDTNVLASANTAETTDTLPVTGKSTTILAILGIALILAGVVFVRLGKRQSVIDPTWPLAWKTLGEQK